MASRTHGQKGDSVFINETCIDKYSCGVAAARAMNECSKQPGPFKHRHDSFFPSRNEQKQAHDISRAQSLPLPCAWCTPESQADSTFRWSSEHPAPGHACRFGYFHVPKCPCFSDLTQGTTCSQQARHLSASAARWSNSLLMPGLLHCSLRTW